MTDRTWTGGVSNDWFTSGNWNPEGTPQSGDTLTVTSGTPTINQGDPDVSDQAIVLGGLTVSSPVTLTAIDATFHETSPSLITITALSQATLLAEGNTSFDGQIYAQAVAGSLTIDSESDGTNPGNFTLSNSDDMGLVLVSHESQLILTGQTITNHATIEIDGSAVVKPNTSVVTGPGDTGFLVLENGGRLSVHGSIDAGQQIDFYDGTGLLTLDPAALSNGLFSPSLWFAVAGGRIDVTGIAAQSERVIDNVLTLYSGANATGSVVAQLNQYHSSGYSVDTSDFTVAPDGNGGTMVTYTPGGSVQLGAPLAVPIVAAPGTMVSLSSMLMQSFGTASPGFFAITLLPATAANSTGKDVGFWAPDGTQAVQPTWYLNGQAITSNTKITPQQIGDVELSVGNSIIPIQFQAQVTAASTGTDSEYVTYDAFTIDPAVASQVNGPPTPAQHIASANAFNAAFPGIRNTNYCLKIAADVAAGGGAPLAIQWDGSLEPTENLPGGFWRIVYTGSSVPDPAQNWSTLVQPGDIVSMAWNTSDQENPVGEADGHVTTVLAGGGPDNTAPITVYDNVYYKSNSSDTSFIGIHQALYWVNAQSSDGTIPEGGTDPASIVIWRLDPHQQYLIQGTSLAEVIPGSVYNNLIQPGGGADTITAGLGNNEIQDTTANLNGITVTDFHVGDMFDFTDLNPAQASAAYVNGALHVSKGGEGVAQITIPTPLPDVVFGLQDDGAGGTLITEENSTPCYCAGTLIETVRGAIPVEELAIGDEVLTLNNGPRPIQWIGRRSYSGRFARGAHVLPIRFSAGALDVNQPRRDLWVSPHHAMFLEGVLIEAIDLVNGVSIIQADRVERVDYFHIELETHDVVVAEGTLSESFVDDDSRAMFHNALEFASLYPDKPAAPARYCAPRRAFGTEVETARKRIAQRAGIPYLPPLPPNRPRALVVDSRVPVPDHDGGSNAVLDHIRALQNAGFAVSFFALDSADRELRALSSLGVTPLRGVFSEVARRHAGQFDLVYLHRVATATRCLKPIRQYFNAQVVYSVADLHHLRLKAQSRFDPGHSVELIEQAQSLALQEISAALSADCVVTHSVSEAAQLQHIPSIAVAEKVRVIPWALPVTPVRVPFNKRSGLAFIGGFAHAPNVDAARWLVHEIMPLVWRQAPDVQCLIVGSDLSDDLHQELAQPRITVLGRVDQLGDVFKHVRLTVAPLRFGAGLKDKVLRSMAAGLPCIGTPEAFSGMQDLPVTISNDCQAQTASDLAAAIVTMHRNGAANARCAEAGLDYIATSYNQTRIDALVREMAEPALNHYRARTGRRSDCAVLQFGAPARIPTKKVVFR